MIIYHIVGLIRNKNKVAYLLVFDHKQSQPISVFQQARDVKRTLENLLHYAIIFSNILQSGTKSVWTAVHRKDDSIYDSCVKTISQFCENTYGIDFEMKVMFDGMEIIDSCG